MPSSNTTILVAVWMVTYNHENYVKQAIESVMMQKTDFDFKLFIGEDSSKDSTRKICEVLQKKFPNKIDLYTNTNNVGPKENAFHMYSKCLNSGATYTALLEGDDYWVDKLKLQKQVDFLEHNPQYSFSWTRFQTLNQNTQKLTLDNNDKHFTNNEDVIDFDFEKSFKGWHMGTQTLVFRNSYFDINALRKFKFFRDAHIIAHLLKKGKGSCLNFLGATYRVHDNGLHNSVSVYEGYTIGYNCNKEIYNDNKANIFVKKKYMLATQNFININIQEGYLLKAFGLTIILFFKQWSIMVLLRNFKRILKRGLNL